MELDPGAAYKFGSIGSNYLLDSGNTDPAALASTLDTIIRRLPMGVSSQVSNQWNTQIERLLDQSSDQQKQSYACQCIIHLADVRGVEAYIDVPCLFQAAQKFLLTVAQASQWDEAVEAVVSLSRLSDEASLRKLFRDLFKLLTTEKAKRRTPILTLLGELLQVFPDLSFEGDFTPELKFCIRDTDVATRNLVEKLYVKFFRAQSKMQDVLVQTFNTVISGAQHDIQTSTSKDIQHGALLELHAVLESQLAPVDIVKDLVSIAPLLFDFIMKKKRKKKDKDLVDIEIARVLSLISGEDKRTGLSIFEGKYGEQAVRYFVDDCLRAPTIDSDLFPTLGQLCSFVPTVAEGFLIPIVEILRIRLNPSTNSKVTVQNALECIKYLAIGLHDALRPHVQTILDSMFASGLSPMLDDALRALVNQLPKLLPYIQARFLDHVSYLLTGLPLADTHTAVAPLRRSETECGFDPRELGEADVIMVAETTRTSRHVAFDLLADSNAGSWVARMDFTPPPLGAAKEGAHIPGNPQAVKSALRMLSHFDISGYMLLDFAADVVGNYFDSPDDEIRRLAADVCVHLLKQEDASITGHTGLMTGTLISRLLLLAVADPVVSTRVGVFSDLNDLVVGPTGAVCTQHLIQNELIETISQGLYDPSADVRIQAIRLLGRIAPSNPGVATPILRDLIIHFLNEIGYNVHPELTASLLGSLVQSARCLLEPYASSILETLLADVRTNGLRDSVASTIGSLVRVIDQSDLARHTTTLQSLLLDAMNSSRNGIDLRKASVETLGKFVRFGGTLVRQQLDYKLILRSLTSILANEVEPTLRCVAIRTLGTLGAIDCHRDELRAAQENKMKLEQNYLENDPLDGQNNVSRRAGRASLKLLLDALQGFNDSNAVFYTANAIVYNLCSEVPQNSQVQKIVVDTYVNQMLANLSDPGYECNNVLFHLALIVAVAPIHTRDNIGRIMDAAMTHLGRDINAMAVLCLIEQVFISMPDEFRLLLPRLVPQIASTIYSYVPSPRNDLIIDISKTICLLAPSIGTYSNLLVPPLCQLLLCKGLDKSIISPILGMLSSLCRASPTGNNTIASSIIHTLLELLQSRPTDIPSFHEQVTECFVDLSLSLGSQFAVYVPPIFRALTATNIKSQRLSDSVACILRGSPPPSYLSQTYPPTHTAQNSGIVRVLQATQPLNQSIIRSMNNNDVIVPGQPDIRSFQHFVSSSDAVHVKVCGIDVALYQLLFFGVNISTSEQCFLQSICITCMNLTPTKAHTARGTEQHGREFLPVNQSAVQQVLDVPQQVGDDWLPKAVFMMLEQCPSSSIRVLVPLARINPDIAYAAMPEAFVTMYYVETELRPYLLKSTNNLLSRRLPRRTAEVVLRFTEAAERNQFFMAANSDPNRLRPPAPKTISALYDVEVRPANDFVIDAQLLAQMSEQCLAYSKALHHQEALYIELLRNGRAHNYRKRSEDATMPLDSDESTACLESIISTQNLLHMTDSARGLLVYARILGLQTANINENLLEDLHCWDTALNLYQRRQTTPPQTAQYTEASACATPREARVDSRSALGELRCLTALSEYEACLKRAAELWDSVPLQAQQHIAKDAVMAAFHLHDMRQMEHYLEYMSKSDFVYALCSGVLLAHKKRFKEAAMQAERARALLDPRQWRFAVEFSDITYNSIINAQQVSELNEAIDTLSRNGDMGTDSLKKVWRERLCFVKHNADVWDKLLSVRWVAIEPRADPPVYTHFASLCAEANRPRLANAVFRDLGVKDVDELFTVDEQRSGPDTVGCFIMEDAITSFLPANSVTKKVIVGRGVGWPRNPHRGVSIECSALNILELRRQYHDHFHGHVRPQTALDMLNHSGARSLTLTRTSSSSDLTHEDNQPYFTLRHLLQDKTSVHDHIVEVVPETGVSLSPEVEFAYYVHEWSLGRRTQAYQRMEGFVSRMIQNQQIVEPVSPASAFASDIYVAPNRMCVATAGHYTVEQEDYELPQPKKSVPKQVKGLPINFDLTREELTSNALLQLSDWAQQLRSDESIEVSDDVRKRISSDTFLLALAQRAALLSPSNADAQRSAAVSCSAVLTAVDMEVEHLVAQGAEYQERLKDVDNPELSDAIMKDIARCDSQIAQLNKRQEVLQEQAISNFVAVLSCTNSGEQMLTDVLQMYDIWVERSESRSAERAIMRALDQLPVEVWLGVIPQIISRMHTSHLALRRAVIEMLSIISRSHPQALIFPLTVAARSSSIDRQGDARQLLRRIAVRYPRLVREAQIVAEELNRVSVLWIEAWDETLSIATKLYFTYANTEAGIRALYPLFQRLLRGPETPNEQQFIEDYGKELFEAYRYFHIFGKRGDRTAINNAWVPIYQAFSNIKKGGEASPLKLDLANISPKLLELKDLELALPDFYTPDAPVTHISSFGRTLDVISSKQRPRKMTITSSDGHECTFLLKGHEDLRSDERAMQLFNLINLLVAEDHRLGNYQMRIIRYAVVPLSTHSGLIRWVEGSDSLFQLVRNYRVSHGIAPNDESRFIYSVCPPYDKIAMAYKLEVFEAALGRTSGDELHHVLWLQAASSEQWLHRRLHFVRAVALTSIVGYVLGLGDRHPNNIMVHRRSCLVVHIDFGDSFEVAQRREQSPEEVPFRLTRILVRAFGPSGVEGDFRAISQTVMGLVRSHSRSVLTILEAFLHDPLMSWGQYTTHVVKGNDLVSISQDMPDVVQTLCRRGADQRQCVLGGDDDCSLDEQLHKEAAKMMARIRDKLSGCDFAADTLGPSLDVNNQVARLIRQATVFEVLSRSYFGWMPAL